MLDGADQQVVQEVPVGEVGGREGRGAAPAADEVDQAVDAAEVLLGLGRPLAGGARVEEVDGVPHDGRAAVGEAGGVDALGQPLGVGVGGHHGGAGLGEPQQRRVAGRAAGAGHGDDRALQRAPAVGVLGHGWDGAHRHRLLLGSIMPRGMTEITPPW